ncbi:MAG: hypothetical protein WCO56_25855 [Verrucomicrobiota bacterium]
MNLLRFIPVYALAMVCCLPGRVDAKSARSANGSAWENAIVTLETTRKQHDMQQPWVSRPQTIFKPAVVIGPRELLTTAEDLFNRIMVRAQKGGHGKWYEMKVTWLDYHADLALVTTDDDEFWKGLKPVDILGTSPDKDNLQLARWKSGNLEIRKADFNQYHVDDSRLSPVPALFLEFDTDMVSLGFGEPIFCGGKLAALVCSQADKHGRALMSTFIKGVLDTRKKEWRGLGYFPWFWQPTENIATHAYLNQTGEPRGVIITQVPEGAKAGESLKLRDIVLQVDGFDIDVQGYYQDPDYGRLILENLAVRNRYAGDVVRLKVWREGKEITVNYRLPKFDYDSKLLPDHVYDREPEYVISGGLLFQPMSRPLLRSWGADWRRAAPFRLTYYDHEPVTTNTPSLVLLSYVLPDRFNIGYQELRGLVVDQVNGRSVRTLAELQSALKQPQNGFHNLVFMRSDSMRHLVLDADELEAATRRVVELYGIPKAFQIKGQ